MRGQDDSFVEYICDQLDAIPGVSHRAMFGGHGLYCGGTFFGIVYKDRLFFKTSETTRPKYEAWQSGPFQPNSKQTLKAYYEVPSEFVDDAPRLVDLAEEAVDAARNG